MSDSTRTLRIGTRGSPLARWQSGWVADRLRAIHPGLLVELVEVRTRGDRDQNSPLAQMGGTGLFTKEIQRALIDDEIDAAVHSLKDLPTACVPGLVLGAVPPREDLADALISPTYQTLDALPSGAAVGTGSPRRRAQLLYIRPDLQVEAIRGNVETRLGLIDRLDAVVLAVAGLKRLRLDSAITERLEPPRFLPAVGQGALGIECRSDDSWTVALLTPLNDAGTYQAVEAERHALAELEGGCIIPLGAWGRESSPGRLTLDVAVWDPDGTECLRVTDVGPIDQPDRLGVRVAQSLRDLGAERLLRPTRGS